jgi:hypothetical protein
MLHRDKRTPGQFMMRLKVPNGIVNSDQMRFYADCVEKYGEEKGVVDITTRQNIQLRGVKIEDAPDIIDGLHARNQTSFQSALDSVRNMVGNPLAGIDDKELIDTREVREMAHHCEIQSLFYFSLSPLATHLFSFAMPSMISSASTLSPKQEATQCGEICRGSSTLLFLDQGMTLPTRTLMILVSCQLLMLTLAKWALMSSWV